MSTGETESTSQDRRVLVCFGEHELFAYRADRVVAERYVDAMGQNFPGLAVTIDDRLTSELRRLPSEPLWTLAP